MNELAAARNAPTPISDARRALRNVARSVAIAPAAERVAALRDAAQDLRSCVSEGWLNPAEAADRIYEVAESQGLLGEPGSDEANVIDDIARIAAMPPSLVEPDDLPPTAEIMASLDKPAPDRPPITPAALVIVLPPLTPAEWEARDLPPPDFLLGYWLTTTTRALLTADTGLGKSMFAMALGMRLARGLGFLHWSASRPRRVLYIDGEMSRPLLKQRIADEEARVGSRPETFFALSFEDIENSKPLNTPQGQAWLLAFIKRIGGVDLIIFDNLMSLTLGDQKDPLVWQQTLPLAQKLTKAKIGQIWIHHTGKNTTDGYGDKTREWQMDTVVHLDAVKRDDTEVSFSLTFKKARERTPATRFDFQDVKIALVNDRWEHEVSEALPSGKVSPRAEKALEALTNVLASDQATMLSGNRRAAHRDHWTTECNARGLIDLAKKPDSARTLMNTFRRDLVAANRIACEGDLQWLIR
jgi:hypothetical protein